MSHAQVSKLLHGVGSREYLGNVREGLCHLFAPPGSYTIGLRFGDVAVPFAGTRNLKISRERSATRVTIRVDPHVVIERRDIYLKAFKGRKSK